MTAVGLDVGARAIHAVALDGARASDAATFPAEDPAAVAAWCAGATQVAVDAPDRPSAAVHSPEATLRKFRTARCAEIAAGRDHGVWVPWVTPAEGQPIPAWMSAGFALWRALEEAGHAPAEVYPAGCFWLLNGRRWPPPKTTVAGRARRLELLRDVVDLPDEAAAWSHDRIDALVAAVVATRIPDRAVAARHGGGRCDASTLWLPP